MAFEEIVNYLSENDGDSEAFIKQLSSQRIGQAFFNSLSINDKNRLVLTEFDPFYSTYDGLVATEKAIEFLKSCRDENIFRG